MKFWISAIVLSIVCGDGNVAFARDVSFGAPATPSNQRMEPYGRAEAPIGYQEFCGRLPAECLPKGASHGRVELTAERWRELIAVNKGINTAIRPISDSAQYGVLERWTYPDLGMGDCEDYVLLKRRELMKLGWPQSALLITVVRDENNEGHAILTVRTTAADYILDNKHSKIWSWQSTPYAFIKRQSGKDPRQWVSLVPNEPNLPIASAGVDWKD